MLDGPEQPALPAGHVLLSNVAVVAVAPLKRRDGATFHKTTLSGPQPADEFSIMSDMPVAWPGQTLDISGVLKTSTYTPAGTSLLIASQTLASYTVHAVTMPSNRDGLAAYLTSFPAIGKATAARVAAIADHTEIDRAVNSGSEDNRIRAILGASRYKKFAAAWTARDPHSSRTTLFLRSLGLSTQQSRRITEHLGRNTETAIRANPYILMNRLRGFSYTRCDTIAGSLGIPPDYPIRVNAAIANCIHEASRQKGHCYLTLAQLLDHTAKIGGIPKDVVLSTIENHPTESLIQLEHRGETIYSIPRLIRAERTIAKSVRRRLDNPPRPLGRPIEKLLEDTNRHLGRSPLNPGQENAFRTILTSGFSILTGYPGTGKTHLLRAITTALIKGCEWRTESIVLAAPTGRGAVNMTKSTGLAASTIASLIRENDDDAPDNPTAASSQLSSAKLVIIDETSMADINTMASLLHAIPPRARVLLVGDPDQLMPVGPGNPFLALIDCGAVPVSRLHQPERQARDSAIVDAAAAIRAGRLPSLAADRNSDWIFIRTKENDDIVSRVIETASTRLTAAYGYDPVDDIQVMAPQKPGAVGTTAFNERLREILTPPTGNDSLPYRVGDKIMQTSNDWNLGVANGEIGRVKEISDKTTVVVYPRITATYNSDELGKTALAYCCTVHKMQGSESPAIVYPMTASHAFMSSRRLVYTALTRGRQKSIFVGQPAALAAAIAKNDDLVRNSLLADMILDPTVGEIATPSPSP